MKDNIHISQTDTFKFQHDLMTNEEKISFLEHISTCDFCAEQFTECMIEDTITAPLDMKENILKAVKRPEIQIAKKVKETSKNIQLVWYSLKVTTAAIGAFAILVIALNFNSAFTDIKDNPTNVPKVNTEREDTTFSLTAAIKDKMDNVSSSILDFSNNIIKTEVIDHD